MSPGVKSQPERAAGVKRPPVGKRDISSKALNLGAKQRLFPARSGSPQRAATFRATAALHSMSERLVRSTPTRSAAFRARGALYCIALVGERSACCSRPSAPPGQSHAAARRYDLLGGYALKLQRRPISPALRAPGRGPRQPCAAPGHPNRRAPGPVPVPHPWPLARGAPVRVPPPRGLQPPGP